MSTQLIVEQARNKVEECLQGVQEELDLSFSRIDAFLDQLPSVPYLPIAHKNVYQHPKFTQLSFPSTQNFTSQLIQQLQPILNLTIHTEILSNQQLQLQLQQSSTNTKDNNQQSNSQPFTYNLIQNHSIQYPDNCYAIAINNDNSIVLAGCLSEIKVFEFQQEQLKLIQLLSEHQSYVYALNFMKKSTQFISGSYDKQIIIWSMNSNSQWICSQKLNEHQHQINCLILNNNEDLIISGSKDRTIKFWIKQNQWTCSQTIKDHTKDVYGLSLNLKQNRIISCGSDMFILIIEESLQKWNVIQKITVEQYGYRICFINDNVFTFQPRLQKYMHVYEINNSSQQYSKTKQIDVKSDSDECYQLFPQQYIKSKCLLVNKNGRNVNLIRINLNGHFITQQSIQLEHRNIYGQLSENGEYLMTWDINIRKFKLENSNNDEKESINHYSNYQIYYSKSIQQIQYFGNQKYFIKHLEIQYFLLNTQASINEQVKFSNKLLFLNRESQYLNQLSAQFYSNRKSCLINLQIQLYRSLNQYYTVKTSKTGNNSKQISIQSNY